MINGDMKIKMCLAIAVILLGVIGRFILVSYVRVPNFEIITALSVVAGMYFGGTYAITIPISAIFLSDLAIGNNYVFIFTWSAFAIIGLAAATLRKRADKIKFSDTILIAITSSIFFYIYTNFGWWIMSGMYEMNMEGLIRCYLAGIPFFRNQLMGNMIFVPIAAYVGSCAFRAHATKQISFKDNHFKLKNNQFRYH